MKLALNSLVYLNPEGKKVRVKAGTIFNDAPKDDVERWESRGNVRDATVGEIAEAVAAGLLDPEHLPGARKKNAVAAPTGDDGARKKNAVAAPTGDDGAGNGTSDKTGDDGAGNGASDKTGDDGAADQKGGASKRQALA